MITSDIEKALKLVISWTEFCLKYSSEKKTYLLREDGVLTSADMNLKFDSVQVFVERCDLLAICNDALDGRIREAEVGFIANAILLSGFNFVGDELDDICFLLSEAESMGEVEEVKNILEEKAISP